MVRKLIFVHLCFALVASKTDASTPKRQPRDELVGDVYYFAVYSFNGTQEEAFKFCKTEGGELAKMTGRFLYNVLLQMIPESEVGSYWIDGKTQLGLESDHFMASKDCTPHELQLQDLPYLGYTSETCLTLVKKSSPRESGYESVPCSNVVKGLICGIAGNNSCY